MVLLARNRREVKLTDAGRAFLKDCRALLDQAQAASNRARQIAGGTYGALCVGVATSAIDHVMPTLLVLLRRQLGDARGLRAGTAGCRAGGRRRCRLVTAEPLA